jgi:hypothetical protein
MMRALISIKTRRCVDLLITPRRGGGFRGVCECREEL